MNASSPNTAWAAALIDEVAACGVRWTAVAPGSRSIPLVLAAHDHGALHVVTHLDERSAGFFALGTARVTGVPAAVITTSGTAVANLLPAVIEAAQSDIPLVILSADRPPEYRGTDANQTIDQIRLFGKYTRQFADLPLPHHADGALETLRNLVRDALRAATTVPPGPVHLNCPFAKPLEPESPDDVGPRDRAVPAAPRGASTDRAPSVEAVIGALRRAQRPLLIAGPVARATEAGAAFCALATALRAPLLADPLSGARFTEGAEATVVAHYDAFLREPAVVARLAPDVVIRFGATPTSSAVSDALRRWHTIPQIVVDDGWRRKDHAGTARTYVRENPAAVAAAASRLVEPAPASWLASWRCLDTEVGRALSHDMRELPFEATAVTSVLDALPAGANLVIGNSMPVRDLDRFAAPRNHPVAVWGNRGASGIDGMVSTALGIAAASGRPTVAVLGDLSFYHDQNGLFATRALPGVLYVVINNDGGGIFHMLPVRTFEPAFTQRIAVPHGFDFGHVAALHGIAYARAECGDDIAAMVRQQLQTGRTALLEVKSNREHNRLRHHDTLERARKAAQAIMASGVRE